MCENDCLNTSQITIPVGPTGANGANGTNGESGSDGSDGIFGGFSAKWLFDTTTSSAVPTTKLRFSNSTLANITSLYVHHNNASSIDHSNFLSTFDNTISTVNYYGLVRIWKKGDSDTFFLAQLTNTITNTNDTELVVEHIQSNGVFAAGDELILNFTPAGEAAEGDKEVLYSKVKGALTSSSTTTILRSETIPANTLVADGDQLQVSAVFLKTFSGESDPDSSIVPQGRVAGEIITPGINFWIMDSIVKELKIDYTLTRRDSTTVVLNLKSFLVGMNNVLIPSLSTSKAMAFDSSIANNIHFESQILSGVAVSALTEFTIKYFNI